MNAQHSKRALTALEQEECALLKAAIEQANELRPKHRRITQSMAAKAMGMTQGAVSNYLNGRLALNKDFALRISALYSIPMRAFSPRLADEISLTAAVAESLNLSESGSLQQGLPSEISDSMMAYLMNRGAAFSPAEVRRARVIVAADRILQAIQAGTLADGILQALEALAEQANASSPNPTESSGIEPAPRTPA